MSADEQEFWGLEYELFHEPGGGWHLHSPAIHAYATRKHASSACARYDINPRPVRLIARRAPRPLYDRLLDAAAEQDGELSALLLSAANRIGADHSEVLE